MLHWIAFIVIGLVIGGVVGWSGAKVKSPITVLILGLIGAIIGGYGLQLIMGAASAKYPSLFTAIIVAAILAVVGRRMGSQR